MERQRKQNARTSLQSASHTAKTDAAEAKPKLEIDPIVTTPESPPSAQSASTRPDPAHPQHPHPQHAKFHHREFNARELDYIVAAITTGRQLERLSDAVAEAVMTKLSRYQRLELDAQFIADAVVKRIEEERLVSRIVGEIVGGAAGVSASESLQPKVKSSKQDGARSKRMASDATQGSPSVSNGAVSTKRSSRRKKP